MICVAYGTVCGWPAASFPELLSPETSPLPIGALDIEQLSWVVSYMCIGAFFGNSFYNWASDRFGRKNALIQSALPCLVGGCCVDDRMHIFDVFFFFNIVCSSAGVC